MHSVNIYSRMTTIEGPTMINHEPTRIRKEPTRTRVPPTRGLRPFDHQVAGQSLILHYDETTICKCLIQREYQFYQEAPQCLQPFIPQFRGVIQLYLPDVNNHDCPPGCHCSRPHHHHPVSPETTLGWLQNERPTSSEVDEGFRLDPSRLRALRKTSRSGNDMNGSLYYFMLLEDLIAQYDHPCILDLKMGVRQHGDDAPAEKVAYQVNKCKTTTSASLGTRLCGMKRYNVSTGQYETKDKMFGRQLTDDELKSQIATFLFNGRDLRSDLLDSIIMQLINMKNALEQLEGYRFYSCSLLIIYEGRVEGMEEQLRRKSSPVDEGDPHLEPDNDMEDDDNDDDNDDDDSEGSNSDESETAAHKITDVSDVSECHSSSDNFISSIQHHNENSQQSSTDKYENQCKCRNNSYSSRQDTSCESEKNACSRHSNNSVDVRIVDFAHATYDGFIGDTVRHCGPDHGFLLGVSTLLEVFRDLKERDES